MYLFLSWLFFNFLSFDFDLISIRDILPNFRRDKSLFPVKSTLTYKFMIPQPNITELGMGDLNLDLSSYANIEGFLQHSIQLNTDWMDGNRSKSTIFMTPHQFTDELLGLLMMEHCPQITFEDGKGKTILGKNGMNMTVWLHMNGITLDNCTGLNAGNWCAVEGFGLHEWKRMIKGSLELFEISAVNEYRGYNSTGELLGHSLALAADPSLAVTAELSNAYQLISETADVESEGPCMLCPSLVVTAELSNAYQLISETADVESEGPCMLCLGQEISQWPPADSLSGVGFQWPGLSNLRYESLPVDSLSEESSRGLAFRE